MNNTHPVEKILEFHEEIIKKQKSTWEFGFTWKPEDGIILYPETIVSGYYTGFFKTIHPEIKLKAISKNVSPAELESLAAQMPNALVVLCEMQSTLNHNIGIDFAKAIQFLPVQWRDRIIIARQLGEFLEAGNKDTKFLDYFRKTYLAAEPANRKKVVKAYNLFDDKLSQATFTNILKRYLLKADTLVPVVDGHMYFDDIIKISPDETIVDCGGYTGDTLQYFLKNIEKDFTAYHIFEPDPQNFENLKNNLDSLPAPQREKVTPYQIALSQSPGFLEFEGKGALESRIDPKHATIKVKSMPLDDVLKDINPTFIKMDLEGHEAFALFGARNTIRRARPTMAICVYHYPFDLWELPLLVNSFVKDYKFVLRAYHEVFDYVCYCIPAEKFVSL